MFTMLTVVAIINIVVLLLVIAAQLLILHQTLHHCWQLISYCNKSLTIARGALHLSVLKNSTGSKIVSRASTSCSIGIIKILFVLLLRSKRKHSSSASSSPVRVHKRKHHHHHHSNKSERKKHKEHRSREEKSSHKQKRKKHHKGEHLADPPDEEDTPADVEFKMPHTRSAVTVIKRPTDPKVSLLAPDLESPVLPACVQNFTETAELLATHSRDQDNVNNDQEIINKDQVMVNKDQPTVTKNQRMVKESPSGSRATDVKIDKVAIVKTAAATSSESIEEDGIEEGEILEGSGTHTPTGSDPPVKDVKAIRKLKRKPSVELSTEKQSSHKLKKRKWKKEKDVSGEKAKKHKLR